MIPANPEKDNQALARGQDLGPDFPWASATHQGLVRAGNEDALLARPDLGLFAVSDGLGGHARGQEASALALAALVRAVERGAGLGEAVRQADREVRGLADPDEARPPGATLTALVLSGSAFALAWAGDSRAWLWDGRTARLLTRDHTWVNEQVEAGLMTPAEAVASPLRSMLTQALGLGRHPPRPLEFELRSGPWRPGQEAFLLATDGLLGPDGPPGPAELALVLARATTPARAVDGLLRMSLDAGGPDNVTVVAAGWPVRP